MRKENCRFTSDTEFEEKFQTLLDLNRNLAFEYLWRTYPLVLAAAGVPRDVIERVTNKALATISTRGIKCCLSIIQAMRQFDIFEELERPLDYDPRNKVKKDPSLSKAQQALAITGLCAQKGLNIPEITFEES